METKKSLLDVKDKIAQFIKTKENELLQKQTSLQNYNSLSKKIRSFLDNNQEGHLQEKETEELVTQINLLNYFKDSPFNPNLFKLQYSALSSFFDEDKEYVNKEINRFIEVLNKYSIILNKRIGHLQINLTENNITCAKNCLNVIDICLTENGSIISDKDFSMLCNFIKENGLLDKDTLINFFFDLLKINTNKMNIQVRDLVQKQQSERVLSKPAPKKIEPIIQAVTVKEIPIAKSLKDQLGEENYKIYLECKNFAQNMNLAIIDEALLQSIFSDNMEDINFLYHLGVNDKENMAIIQYDLSTNILPRIESVFDENKTIDESLIVRLKTAYQVYQELLKNEEISQIKEEFIKKTASQTIGEKANESGIQEVIKCLLLIPDEDHSNDNMLVKLNELLNSYLFNSHFKIDNSTFSLDIQKVVKEITQNIAIKEYDEKLKTMAVSEKITELGLSDEESGALADANNILVVCQKYLENEKTKNIFNAIYQQLCTTIADLNNQIDKLLLQRKMEFSSSEMELKMQSTIEDIVGMTTEIKKLLSKYEEKDGNEESLESDVEKYKSIGLDWYIKNQSRNLFMFADGNNDGLETEVIDSLKNIDYDFSENNVLDAFTSILSLDSAEIARNSHQDKTKSRSLSKERTLYGFGLSQKKERVYYARLKVSIGIENGQIVKKPCNSQFFLLLLGIEPGHANHSMKSDFYADARDKYAKYRDSINTIISYMQTDWDSTKISEEEKEARFIIVKQFLEKQLAKLGYFVSNSKRNIINGVKKS